ncbi:MAG: TIGR03619 family F420-dependent LLM class oxidoreductase [Pseudomonadota bacterium]
MRLGIVCGLTTYLASVKVIARHIEAAGFESMWMPDHPVMPVRRASSDTGGGTMPTYYAHLLDPFVGLAAAAGATASLRLGTSVALIAERDPLVTAKEVSTIDLTSNGRFELGIGAGWLREEGELLGVNWPRRWAQTREHLLAMRACWSHEVSEFHGEFVDFPPLVSDPKPVQNPHPPVLIAGELQGAATRVTEYGDGWMPRYDRISLAGLRSGSDAIRQRLAGAGRDPGRFATTVFRCPPETGAVAELAATGVERALIVLPPVAGQEALDTVSQWSETLLPAAGQGG